MTVLCTIATRGGSKGIPGKSLRQLNGQPLISYTMEQARNLNIYDKVMLSTDSPEIAQFGAKSGIDSWFIRPNHLATDSAPKVPVIRHALVESEKYYGMRFDVVVDLDITSPLRSDEDVIGALTKFSERGYKVLFAVCEARKNPYFNMVELDGGEVRLVKGSGSLVTCRQGAPEVFEIHASIYIWERDTLLTQDSLFTKGAGIYVVPQERSMDIDSQLEWTLVEHLLQKDH